MIYVITGLSFFLQNIFSLYLNYSPFFNLFVICTLVFIYPLFQNNNHNYWRYCLIVGLFYDVILTNSLFFNTIIFVILGMIVSKINVYFVNNMYSTIFMTMFIIFSYLAITYSILVIAGQLEFEILQFLGKFYDTILLNIVYSGLFFMIVEKLSQKYRILKMN